MKGIHLTQQPRTLLTVTVLVLAVSSTLLFVYNASIVSWLKSTAAMRKVCPSPYPELVEFSEHEHFMSLDHKYDDHWSDLLTPNGGFFKKADDEGNVRNHGIAMFHSLHCLQMIRAEVQMLVEKSEGVQSSSMPGKHEHVLKDKAHWLHCFDYIRQGILCAADGTVESPKNGPHAKDQIDGNFVMHQCRDPEPLYKLARKAHEESAEALSPHNHHEHHEHE